MGYDDVLLKIGAFMSNYPEEMVKPMRDELVRAGFKELKSPEEVESSLNQKGLSLVVVNSVCGCAAAGARPGVLNALSQNLKFDQLFTVFAGMEKDATSKVREFFEGAPPTSPQVAILRDGQLVHLMQRADFLGQTPEVIGAALASAYGHLSA